METPVSAERTRVLAIADEYRRRGYEVLLEPNSAQLPVFLAGHTPDLMARSGDESVVVEVKSRKSLASKPGVRELARKIQGMEGWRFELILVSEDEYRPYAGAHAFDREEIEHRITEAEGLIATGSVEAALLLTWAAAEASLRRLIEEDGGRPLAPSQIVKQAVSQGVISREDYDLLSRASHQHDAIAHGFQAKDLDASLVQGLIRCVTSLNRQLPGGDGPAITNP